jgi:ketosteroid isomerase-like protein
MLLAVLLLSAADPAWFQKTAQAMADAVASGDKSVWDAVLAPDFSVTTEDGEVLDRKRVLDDLRPLPAGFSGVLKVVDLTVKDLGEAAVVHYWLDETETIFGQALHTRYVETDTWRRAGAGWKLLASHVTVVPRDLEPIEVDKRGWPSLAGEYRLSEKTPRRYRVFLRDGSLYGGPDEKSATLLIPLAPLVFHQKGSIHLMIFVRDASGAVREVREIHKYNELRMTRVPP